MKKLKYRGPKTAPEEEIGKSSSGALRRPSNTGEGDKTNQIMQAEPEEKP